MRPLNKCVNTLLFSAIVFIAPFITKAQVVTGSYTGNGTSQSITTPGFLPDIVIVKRGNTTGTGQPSQIRTTNMSANLSVDFGASATQTSGTDRITSLDANGFSVGSSATTNTSGDTYHYVAIKNKANEIATGTYTGNGTDNTNITGLSFQPDLVMVFSAANLAAWRTSAHSGDNSSSFTSALTADWIQVLNSNGFQVGTDVRVNTNGTTYYYLACKSVSGSFGVGTYTGNATDNRSITGFGFQPGFVAVKGSSSATGGMKTSSTGNSTDLTLVTNATNSTTDGIQQLLSDGIEVGTATRANGNTFTYYYFAFKETTTNTWNGTTWSGGTPTSTSDVVIASSTTPGSFSCKDLTINNSISLTINSGATATISGDVTNNGNGISGTGALTFAKAGTQALNGTAFSVNGTITVNSGATLTTNNKLTLSSNASNTGRIANSAGTISGNVTMQRYIPAGKRALRLFAHPFTSTLTLNSLTDDIDITGSGGSANGFTTVSGNVGSSYWFNTATADNTPSRANPGWTEFTSATTTSGNNGWAQYQGISVLYRGIIGEGLGAAVTPSANTLDVTGALNQGNQVVTCTKGAGSTLVLIGNPYPSNIDLNLSTRGSNIGSSFYTWDAYSGAKGAYVTNAFSSSYILASFMGFFVSVAANTNNTITFHEADKVATNPSASLFKTTGNPDALQNGVLLKLYSDNESIKWDELKLYFDNRGTADSEWYDAIKLYNPDASMYSFAKNGTQLALDVRPYTDNEVIPMGLVYAKLNTYKLIAEQMDMPIGTHLFLHDKYLNNTVELYAGDSYQFDVTSDALSQGNNRFELATQGIPSGISTATKKPKVQLVPNPTKDNVIVYYEGMGDGDINITITNMVGVKVATAQQRATNNGSIHMSLQNIANGIYIVTVQNGNQTIIQKLVKE